MMSRILKWMTLGTLAGALFIPAGAFAQNNRTPVINHRQTRQQGRIAQGVRSGQLTPHETAHIERQEARIQHQKVVAKRTGNMNPAERAKLNGELNHTNREIYRDKHNGRTAQ